MSKAWDTPGDFIHQLKQWLIIADVLHARYQQFYMPIAAITFVMFGK